MKEVDRRTARACLAAVEANLAELRGIPEWWSGLGPEVRRRFEEFAGEVRAWEHALEGLRYESARPATQEEVVEAAKEGFL